MPKARNGITSSTAASTITIPSGILQSSSIPHYIHNTSYGLLEPVQPQAILRPSLHYRRKSSSSTTSSWSERGFDLIDLKDKGVDLGGKIREKLPGVRYSATFISALRTNLALSASLALPSPNLLTLSPNLLPTKSFLTDISEPPPFPQHSRRMVHERDSDSLDNIPDLTFSTPKTPEDKTTGLKLVADILSQQRSTASKALIYNPVTLAIWIASVALLLPFVYRNPATDKPNLAIMVIGMIMCVLAGIRYLVKPYQDLAEQINWIWLGDDEMMIAKYGETVIGSCIYRIEFSNGKKGSSSSSSSSNSKRLLIRAWTTRPRERRRGIGRGTLEKVVEIAKQKSCQSVEFAPDELRAGSTRLLTQVDAFGGWFGINASFDADEQRARRMLDDVLDELWVEKRRRGSR